MKMEMEKETGAGAGAGAGAERPAIAIAKRTKANILSCQKWLDANAVDQNKKCSEVQVDSVKFQTRSQKSLRKKNVNELQLHLDCEWIKCCFTTMLYTKFQKHVQMHISDVSIKNYNTDEGIYACLWDLCCFETNNSEEMERHVNFHAYHTRLKAIGLDVEERFNLDKCKRDSRERNQLPECLSPFTCFWKENSSKCSLKFPSIQEFIDHIQCHIIGVDAEKGGFFQCGWFGCTSRVATLNKLKLHSRLHTKERVVACPQCGISFANNAGFEDHCTRQSKNSAEHKCEICGKFFGSERLLRKHARRHINSFKCTYCDMTLPSPSALSKHIRYCHLDYRPFACHYCNYRAVSKEDIKNHIRRHEGLIIKNSSKVTNDSLKDGLYACHCCDQNFKQGYNLSNHLVQVHGYSRSAGFQRFRYKRSEDGFYRFIPIRYESVEVCNEIIAGQNENSDQTLTDGDDFKLVQYASADFEKPASFAIIPSSIKDQELKKLVNSKSSDENFESARRSYQANPEMNTIGKRKRAPNKSFIPAELKNKRLRNSEKSLKGKQETPAKIEAKSIEISIAEMDHDGNIIKSQVLKSEELII